MYLLKLADFTLVYDFCCLMKKINTADYGKAFFFRKYSGIDCSAALKFFLIFVLNKSILAKITRSQTLHCYIRKKRISYFYTISNKT